MIVGPRFTLADANRAHDEWGANCGPGALAAIVGMTLDEVRPHLIGFDTKRYTNPTMMFAALKSIGAKWRTTQVTHHSDVGQHNSLAGLMRFPAYGLVRVQWEGPWTQPNVPIRARYRYTHWVGAAKAAGEIGVFDINCINNGSGWVELNEWESVVVPYILKECVPRANGKWHITHAIEVDLREAA